MSHLSAAINYVQLVLRLGGLLLQVLRLLDQVLQGGKNMLLKLESGRLAIWFIPDSLCLPGWQITIDEWQQVEVCPPSFHFTVCAVAAEACIPLVAHVCG